MGVQVGLRTLLVRQLIEKGFMSLAYDDFEEEGMSFLWQHPTVENRHPNSIPRWNIGTKVGPKMGTTNTVICS